MSRIDEKYRPAIIGKHIPIVTLDHKWHQIFIKINKPQEVEKNESRLNELLRRQGKCNTESKDIKIIKKKMMDEIVTLMEEDDSASEKKIEENRRLINECNEKLSKYQEELLDLPREINDINNELMLQTMEVCYQTLHQNEKEIIEISQWIQNIRIELKKNVVRKQEMEIESHELYSYMHDIFGADVIDLFDMKYNPMEKSIKMGKENK